MAFVLIEILVFGGGFVAGMMFSNLIKPKPAKTEKAKRNTGKLTDEDKEAAEIYGRSFLTRFGANARELLVLDYNRNGNSAINPYTDKQYQHALALVDKEQVLYDSVPIDQRVSS